MRFPCRIVFPFGFVISVRQVTDSEMKEAADGGEADGLWLVDSREILILKTMPIKRRRYILAHELNHALTDFVHHYLNCGKMKA